MCASVGRNQRAPEENMYSTQKDLRAMNQTHIFSCCEATVQLTVLVLKNELYYNNTEQLKTG